MEARKRQVPVEAPVPRVPVHARLGRRRPEPEEYDTGREEEEESDFNKSTST